MTGTIWKISPRRGGWLWEDFENEGYAMLGNYGIDGLGDLKQYSSREELKDAGVSPLGAKALWQFYKEVSIGDIMVAYNKRQIWSVGVVDGKYYHREHEYVSGENYLRRVKWKKEQNLPFDVTRDKRLYGNPPEEKGVLNKQNVALFEIDNDDWDYMTEKYPFLIP